MNGINQILARDIVYPRLVLAATSPNFGDNHETIWIRMESFLNDLIRHVRTIEIAGVDVVHAGSYRFTQHGDGGIGIARWPKHDLTAELPGRASRRRTAF